MAAKRSVLGPTLTYPQYLRSAQGRFHFQRNKKVDLCGKGLFPRNHIQKRMVSHDRDNSYCYTLCGKEFISRNRSLRNMNSHTAKNPYHCALGGKEFITRTQIKRHMKHHYRENPFRCQVNLP